MPGLELSLGPATFRTWIRCRRIQFMTGSIPGSRSRSTRRQGRPRCRARSQVSRVPPSVRVRNRIRVPFESRTFQSVRWPYRPRGVSRSGYRVSRGPSSAWRPLGHHPPQSSASSKATSRAARSTPVCPPETIRFGWSCTLRPRSCVPGHAPIGTDLPILLRHGHLPSARTPGFHGSHSSILTSHR